MKGYSAYVTRISDLEQNLRESLEFIGWTDVVRSDSLVFIKPNFTCPYYKEGITTSPEVLRVLCEILKDRCDQVVIGESNGGNHSYTADDAFKGHGVDKICGDIGVERVNLSTLPSQYVEDVIQGKRVKVQVPNTLLDDIDCFMSLPVLKVHVMTTVNMIAIAGLIHSHAPLKERPLHVKMHEQHAGLFKYRTVNSFLIKILHKKRQIAELRSKNELH